MLVEEQISARQQRAHAAIASILAQPDGQAYGDYEVKSSSGRKYRVAMRGPSVFENFCSCPDFATNTLGTCKHIEALLLQLRERFGRSIERQRYRRTRASLSLHYGETLDVRLRLPADAAKATDRFQPLERAVAALCRTDPQTQRPVLAIPLPEAFSPERLAGALSGLLSRIAGSA